MGKKIPRSFFEADEILFVGYSHRQEAFCKAIYDRYSERGTKVYPVNPKPEGFGIRVWPSIEAVEAKPQLAYVLTGKQNSSALIDSLAAKGVKRVLFQSAMSAGPETQERCAQLGMEAKLGCPMMVLGGGFHRFHAFLAGVRR